MTPEAIRDALYVIRDNFPKKSTLYIGYVNPLGAVGKLQDVTDRSFIHTAKRGIGLQDGDAPTVTFDVTDEAVIEYTKRIAEEAVQIPRKMLVAIELNKPLTSVYVVRKGMCFVATAAFGSPLATEVDALCDFRDQVLMRSAAGSLFVREYYRYSPSVAAVVARSPVLRGAVRGLIRILLPVVRFVLRGCESRAGM